MKKENKNTGNIGIDINDFIHSYLYFIHSPIIKNKLTGFNLTNGSRIFFKDMRLTKENNKKLSDYYKKTGMRK